MYKPSGEASRKIRLCVDSYKDGIMKGRYYMQSDSGEFESVVQFLSDVETVFDEMNFPQAYTAKRSFTSPAPHGRGEEPGTALQTGEAATFVIRILFRQHTSWQGSVTWVEEDREQTFRSVLELILLIDGALGGCRQAAGA